MEAVDSRNLPAGLWRISELKKNLQQPSQEAHTNSLCPLEDDSIAFPDSLSHSLSERDDSMPPSPAL